MSVDARGAIAAIFCAVVSYIGLPQIALPLAAAFIFWGPRSEE